MTASFSTLTATERCIVAAPRNCWEVSSAIHDFGNIIDCSARHFHGKLVLNAVKLGNDCFDVTVQNYNHMQGRLVKGRLVRFITTGSWLNDWLATVGAEAAL